MKPRALQLSIPKPCGENWDEMMPVNGGRHCAQCSKAVTDFTGMTDRELFQVFKNGQLTCGRFYPEQLDRMILAPAEPKHSFWMKIAVGTMVLLGIAKEGKAQQKAEAPVENAPSAKAEHIGIAADGADTTGIRGIVTDEKGEPIPSVSVILTDTAGKRLAITSTDYDGEYLIVLEGIKAAFTGSIMFVGQAQREIVTNIPFILGQVVQVSHKMQPDLRKGLKCNLRVTTGMVQMLQPEGIHTTHTMTDRE